MPCHKQRHVRARAQGMLRELRVLVFDEADNLLDMGFKWVARA